MEGGHRVGLQRLQRSEVAKQQGGGEEHVREVRSSDGLWR